MVEENNFQIKKKEPVLKKSVDFIFNHKAFSLVLLIFIFGLTLRFFAAVGVEPNADEMVHGPHASGIIDSGVIGRVWQSILWSYLTDFFQQLMGITLLSTRFLSFLFGSLSIIVIYLIGKELFDKKIAVLGAFFLAVSSFHILFTLVEMDIAAVFFVLLAALFFVKRLKKDSKISPVAAVFIGIAALIKTLALFFVPAFVVGFIIYRKKLLDKKTLLPIIYFGLIILSVFSPIFIHNWLWWQEDKMVDAYLAQYFNIGEAKQVYEQAQGVHPGFKFDEVIKGSIEMGIYYLKTDPINIILGVLGIALCLYRKEKFSIFFALFQIIPFLMVTVTNRLQTHYAIFPPIFALYGAFLIVTIAKKYSQTFSTKKILLLASAAILIFNLFLMFPDLTQKSAIGQMRDYASKEIGDKDIVVVDGRIYRGRIMWMFLDKHYLESPFFPELINRDNQAQGSKSNYNLFFIECVKDDCGWGTIANQQDFNASVEELVGFFKSNSAEQKTILGRNLPDEKSTPYFKIYKTSVSLDSGILGEIDSTHNFFFYPAFYKPKEQILDYYELNGATSKFAFFVAKAIIWLSFVIAIASIFLVFYIFWKEEKNDNQR